MISKRYVKNFVRKDELEKIENYDKAVADNTLQNTLGTANTITSAAGNRYK